jgi:hypothetical protein
MLAKISYLHITTYVNNMRSQNVLEVNKTVLIIRPDDGPIGLKHVALNVLLIVIIDVLDKNINTLYKIWNTS